MRIYLYSGVIVMLLVTGCESPESGLDSADIFTDTAEQATAAIDESFLERHVAALSHDSLQGRAPASEGDSDARAYLVEQLESLGFQPGARGGEWQQYFDIVGITTETPETWTFSGEEESLTLDYWDDFVATSGRQEETTSIEDREVVFVGYGIEAPEYDWDDFKGQDLSDKVLLMLNNDPDWDPELFEGSARLYYGRWTYKYESAARQGASGAIIIHTEASAGYPFQVVQTGWSGEQFELPAGDEPRLDVTAWVSQSAARSLVGLSGQELDNLVEMARSPDFEPVPLGVTTSISLENKISSVRTANVIGELKGSDPDLRDEAVVYLAHHDHLGVGKPDSTGDAIYNGARDNASGTAQVLAVGRAMTRLTEAPSRSIVLLLVGGEESGLLGSEFYAAHPSFPAGKIAAAINFDAANIWGKTNDVVLIGLGKSSLDEVAQTAAAHQGRTVKGDQFPDRGYYYRSDQFSFAKIGVPALYFNTGTDFVDRPEGWGKEQINRYTSLHYHQPSDELHDSWDFGGMVQDARLGFWAGLIVAEAPDLPGWTPGDEFEAARKEAISNAAAAR